MAWPNSQERRVELEVQSAQVPALLTDFPVLITRANLPDELCSPTDANRAQADGGDIRAASNNDGTSQLALEIVAFEYDSVDGAGDADIEIWVKVPSVSATVNTAFWLAYKTSGTTAKDAVTATHGRNAVWADYAAVFHLQEDATGGAGSIVDASGNGNDLSPAGTVTDALGAFATAGGGLDFDGNTANHLSLAALPAASLPLTFSCLANVDDLVGGHTLVAYDDSTSSGDTIRLSAQGNATGDPLRAQNNSNTAVTWNHYSDSGSSCPANTWFHAAGVHTTSATQVYLDGVAGSAVVTEGTPSIPSQVDQTRVGARRLTGALTQPLDGAVDEIRIRAGALTSSWFTAEKNNQLAPATFVLEGTPESAITAFSGTAAQSLPSLSQAAAASQLMAASGAQQVPAITSAASGALTVSGAAASAVPAIAQSASGSHVLGGAIDGVGANTAPAIAQAAAGLADIASTGALALPAAAQSASGGQAFTASSDQVLPAPAQAGAASSANTASAAALLPAARQVAGATQAFTAAGLQVIPSLRQAGTATASTDSIAGAALQTLPALISVALVEISVPDAALDFLGHVENDFDAFFDLVDGFAVAAAHPTAGVFKGIFSDEALSEPGADVAMAELLCRSSDVTDVHKGHTVTVAGTAYRVAGRLPDGTGLTRLVFHR